MKKDDECIIITPTGYEIALFKKELSDRRSVVRLKSGVLCNYDLAVYNEHLLPYSVVTTHRLQKEFGYLKQFSREF